ncbi:Retrovirus-related Pol poly from transposon 412 [Paramuricea clavata]|uniref:Retrovirus-related Pol poly from transposon 412 n=1 Tax=Paramuricea clavata TaxID=317549 RepID=A0A7D9ENI0_PARCT|nr:Retrovirus-related Pol poly from transposon 412 [Paramuricea clavata]
MPMTTRSAARLNSEETNEDDMDDRGEENTRITGSDENFVELFSMMKQQTELIMEHKVAQTKQMNEIQRLIGDIDGKMEGISKRQDRLERRLDRVETDLAYVSGEVEKSGESQRNTMAVSVECFEARLDVVENRVDRFGEGIDTIQKELVPKLKESVLEELLAEINLKETRKQNLEMLNRDVKNSPQGIENIRANKIATPVFPSPRRRYTPSTLKPEDSGCVTSTNVRVRDAEAPNKLLQKPTTFDGTTLWESYYAQFEIVAQLNKWNDFQKAAYLATSLKGPALAVLGNLAPEERQNLDVLVVALKNRFGTSHQTELSRMKFKNRIKQKDESLPEMAEDIERLCRLAYPDAPPTLRDVLARDQFVDALTDEDTRLRIKQERPKSLRKALEAGLELESFQIAARQRLKVSRETELLRAARPSGTEQKEQRKYNQLEEGKLEMTKILERLERSMKLCLDGVLAAVKVQRRSPKKPGCWNCGDLNHIRRNCPKTRNDDEESDDQGNGK